MASLATLAIAGFGVTACSGGGGAHSAAVRDGVHLTGATGTPTTAAGCTGAATVTASATGSASATPDTLSLNLGITTTGSTASAALSANNTKVKQLIAAITNLGVPASGISTTNLNVYPTYKNVKGQQVRSGFTVNDFISVQTTKTDLASSIINAAANIGGNDVQFNGIDFSLANDQAPAVAARQAAVSMAEARAQAMAGSAGVTLGPLCAVNDDASPDPVYYAGNSGSFSAAGGTTGAAAPTGNSAPIESGSSQVTATVTVVYSVLSGTSASS